MPRKRMIDPGIWEDLTIGQLTRDARLCFIGLLSHADDEGRVQVDARYVKRAVFGFDDDLSPHDVGGIVDELREHCGNLEFYAIEGRQLAVFRNWRRYQYIQKPQPSNLPGPSSASGESGTVPVSYQSDNGNVSVSPNRIEVNRIEVNRTEPNARARGESDRIGSVGSLSSRPENERPDQRILQKLRDIGLGRTQAQNVLAKWPRIVAPSIDDWGQWIAGHLHGEDGIENAVAYAYKALMAGNRPDEGGGDNADEIAADAELRAGKRPLQETMYENEPERDEVGLLKMAEMLGAHRLKGMPDVKRNPYQTSGPDQ